MQTVTCFYCLEVLLAVGEDEEISLTEMERIRHLADDIHSGCLYKVFKYQSCNSSLPVPANDHLITFN